MILWCGGEDIDFQGGSSPNWDATSGRFRSSYARGSIYGTGTPGSDTRSNPITPVTSAWLSAYIYVVTPATSRKRFGFAKSGTNGMLLLSSTAGSANQLELGKFDGTTYTVLATEVGNSLPGTTLVKIDIQLVNYGASATVNVYANGLQIISYTGNVAVAGVTSIDQFIARGDGQPQYSEVIIADEDTRSMSLMTHALTGAGTTDQWTGLFSTINQTTFSDASPNYSNTNAQDQQFNVTDLPTGIFAVRAVKVSARMAQAAGAVTKVSLGYNNGGTVNFGTGAQKTLTTAYATYEQLDATDPTKGAAWAQADMNGLQVDLRSAT